MSRSSSPLPVRQRIRWSVPTALAAAIALSLGTSADASVGGLTGNQRARTDANLLSLAAKHPARQVEVIVQFKENVSEKLARANMRLVTHQPGVALPLIHGLAARMRADQAARLTRRRAVRAVTLNGPVHSQAASPLPSPTTLQTTFNSSVGADRLWNKATGKGVGVAVIDTGTAGDLPDFRVSATDTGSRVVASVVTNPDATTAADTFGHGTHVAGIIAGNGNSRDADDSLFGRYAGVAPEANLISIKAADDNGDATVVDVLWGIQFALSHKDQLGIRVLNLSLSSSTAISYRYDPLDAAVEVAWLQGIVVVAAAGNRGTAADAVQYAPGNDPLAISVGALDENGTASVKDDTVAPFSSRGTTQDGFAKPEIYAPGRGIVSLLSPNSAFASLCPSCIFDGAYIRAGGTSMSAPIVAGAAALLLQLHPEWTPDQVKGAIINSAQTGTRDRVGELDVYRAAGASGAKLNGNRGVRPSYMAVWINNAINTYGWTSDDSADTVAGVIDQSRSSWSRSSWSRSSWSQATGDLAAGFARSSWSCEKCTGVAMPGIEGTRSSWGRSSWSNVLEG